MLEEVAVRHGHHHHYTTYETRSVGLKLAQEFEKIYMETSYKTSDADLKGKGGGLISAMKYEGNDNAMEGINDRWKQWRKEAGSNNPE